MALWHINKSTITLITNVLLTVVNQVGIHTYNVAAILYCEFLLAPPKAVTIWSACAASN